jgi:hypothetical protein
MGILSSFGFTTNKVTLTPEIPNIWPLDVKEEVFIEQDLKALFQKILTDVCERTHGIPQDQINLLFDNCHAGSPTKGLITLLADAMYAKSELYVVYNPSLGVLRVATDEEKKQIREDYAKSAQSTVGTFITFKNFDRKDILQLYSMLEYCLIGGLHKSVKLSMAVLLKMNALREAVGAIDAPDVVAQAQDIAKSLSEGKDVLLDAKDILEMIKPDLTSVEKGMEFLNQKRAFYLGFPQSYISGQTHGGLGDSGTGETKAIDRGLKAFYYSIIKPVVEKIFSVETTFKSNDLSHLPQALEVLKAFEITGDEYLPQDQKQIIVSKVFDLEPEA